MQSEFIDRVLSCADCQNQFVFTAGEQIFFFDKQFKNDPKRCKPCKAKRQGSGGAKPGGVSGMAANSRTETRTECSECHIETTVPFKPTQGRPVLCRQCFQGKRAPAILGPVNAERLQEAAYGLSSTAEALPDRLSAVLAQPVA